MTTFSVEGHVASRQHRHSQSDIYNKQFPGLATIELNITELCNRTCSFCPRHDPQVYPNQKLFMELDTVATLTSQLKSAAWHGDIHITGFGEPHTHPQLREIISILREANVYIEVTTNGDRLIDTDIDYSLSMFKAGLDMLTVDCYDGKEQYLERENKMLNVFQDVHNYRLRNHYDTGNPEDLIAEYGFNNRAGAMGGNGIQGQCYLPFYKAFVDWDGEVRLCCNDWHRKAGTMGNILDIGFSECWKGQKLQMIRKHLSRGQRGGACSSCNINGKKFGKESYDFLISTSD